MGIKATFTYLIKKVQFYLQTQKRAVEIAKAYGEFGFKPLYILMKYRHYILSLLLIVIVIIGGGIYFYNFFKALLIKREISSIDTEYYTPVSPIEKKSEAHLTLSSKEEEIFSKDSIDTEKTISFKKPMIKKYSLIPLKDSSQYFILLVNKAIKTMYLLQEQEKEWRVVKEYDVALGEKEGPKNSAGDRRTPEGYYLIVGRKEKSELTSIYGPLSYILDYPNEEDKKMGRSGGGIWIHGTDPDSAPLQTRGCIEMHNKDLLELGQTLKLGLGTPVVIVYDEKMEDPVRIPDYKKCEERRKRFLRNYDSLVNVFTYILNEWKSAWERKDIEKYSSFYDTLLFKGQGLEWAEWKEKKLRTFELYDTISIILENITVINFKEELVIVKFFQKYRTNLNNIDNGKKIIFEKINDMWKITGESTCSKEEILL
ncbi:MAG: L,D-transpeptidase family protein [Chitinispirillaceae bacterium]|nr:L,D-transpeptidase family protein [Chitinispirillaceae bacterium]